MLVLTFQIGTDRLALDIRQVREVVPRVQLRQSACSPPWLAGVFVYRGQIVPVIDLHQLAGAGECPPHLSSRIILVPVGPEGENRLLGLLAAQVADIREIQPPSGAVPYITNPGELDFGPVLTENGEILHFLELERLLPEPVQRQLAVVRRGSLP